MIVRKCEFSENRDKILVQVQGDAIVSLLSIDEALELAHRILLVAAWIRDDIQSRESEPPST